MFKAALGPQPDWEMVSQEWERSGLSQKKFCKQRGYSYSRFKNARGRLGHSRPKKNKNPRVTSGSTTTTAKSSNLSFLPLTVEEESVSGERYQAVQGAKLEVELPFGVVLRFQGVDSNR